MPFSKIELTNSNQSIPVFLFPGISANTIEMNEVIYHLTQQTDWRNFYVYADPHLINPKNLSYHSLPDETLLTGQEMPAFPYKPYPIKIVGYSYGCLQAFLLAQYLQLQGHEPHLFLIDQPAPDVTQAFFARDDLDTTKDLIDIVEYVAKLSYLNSIKINPEDVVGISEQPFLNRLVLLAEIIKQKQHDADPEMFNQFIHIIQQKLTNLKNFQQLTPDNPRLDTINVLMLDSTTQKYKTDQTGGWSKFAENVIPITIPSLNCNHIELLNSKNASMIAAAIHERFSKEVPAISKQEALTRELFFKLCSIQQENPDINVSDVLSDIQNKTSARCLLNSVSQSPLSHSPSTGLQTPENSPRDNMHIEEVVTGDKVTPRTSRQGLFKEKEIKHGYNTRMHDVIRQERLSSSRSRSPS